MGENIVSAALSFGVTFLVLLLLKPLATRIGLVDCPGGRKWHDGAVPLIGGIAMFCGFLFAVLTLDTALTPLRPLFAGAALLVLVGVLDDFHELSSRPRLAAQVGAAVIMVYWGDVRLHDLGALVSSDIMDLGVWSVPFTVFATVGVINALNMADGLDGLAGNLAIIALAFMAALAAAVGTTSDAWVLLVLVCAVLAFLALNLRLPWRRQADIFMGDAGSMFLGFAIAWFCVSLSQGEGRAMTPITALWLFALPLADTVSVMLRRLLRGRSPFSADREHFHHILMLAGYNVNQSVLIMTTISLIVAVVGVGGLQLGVPEQVMFYVFLGLFAVYFWGMTRAWRVMRAIRTRGPVPSSPSGPF